MNVTTGQTTIKPNEHGGPFSQKTSNDSPLDQAAGDGMHITVKSGEKSTSGNSKSRKIKPRRHKLKELNDIIRDLQRDVTNDDDLVVSEVSSILSPEVRYENFETKPDEENYNEHGSTKKIPSMRSYMGERARSRSIITSTASSRLHRPSAVSAHDIHSEIPSDIPEQSIAIDAKVGTENVLRFPVSVQTDTIVDIAKEKYPSPRHETTEPTIVQTRKPSVQTRELSIQTEKESKNIPARIVTCDVAINTENVQKDESKAVCLRCTLYCIKFTTSGV